MEELMEKPKNKSRKKGKQKKPKEASTSRAPPETESVERQLKNAAEEVPEEETGAPICDNATCDSEVDLGTEDVEPKEEIQDETEGNKEDLEEHDGNKEVLQENVEVTLKDDKVMVSSEARNHYANLNIYLNQIKLSDSTVNLESEPRVEDKLIITPYTESQLCALYMNSELTFVERFTDDFVEAELKGLNMKQHPLFEMLTNYLQARNRVHRIELEMNQLRKDYLVAKEELWTVSSTVVSKQGHCSDGNVIRATYTATKATFHRNTSLSVNMLLGKMRELSTEGLVLYRFTAALLKIEIQLYVDSIVSTLMAMPDAGWTGPDRLYMRAPPPRLHAYICDLRLCISIIFHFQRRLIRDVDFIKETRQWLSALVRLLLDLATWQDHLFIINHILRCPAGISSWASTLVHVPLGAYVEAPFSNYEINHLVSILALVLMPVQRRDKFLEEMLQKKDEPADALWVIVDSDGEEDEDSGGVALRENDLVALLNQIPLENLFRNILRIQKIDNKDVYDGVDEGHILRFFSFSTNLLRILHRGLKTYDQSRYIQFCKRLSRLIRHVVQYATDQWEWFAGSGRCEDAAMLERLQVEYDAFFLRAIFYLYTSEKLGAWQFLAVVPFGLVAERTLWKIFFFLHDVDSKPESILDPVDKKIYTQATWESLSFDLFEEKLSTLPEDECYYLLNTFANMALSRPPDDTPFIRTATIDLLRVGFFLEATQDSCAKNARILLTHITSKHPHLLTDIMQAVRENFAKIGSLSLYLYEDLPISVWRLEECDVDVLASFILHNPLQSDESKLSRMIISRLNWGLDEEGTLFLPYSTHCKIALLITTAVELDVGYLQWAWQTAFRLRLHISDKAFASFQHVKDIEHFDVVYKGVRSRQAFACFLSVLMSSYGHHVPLICSKGMDQLLLLQANQKHEAVLFALNLIVPLFVNCQESLINLEKFQAVLQALLSADRTYVNYAKSFVMSPNLTILEQFGNMIESQIANHEAYGLDSPRYIARLWINSLVSVPNWNRDSGAIYLLDVIVKASFFHKDTIDVISGIIRDLLQSVTPEQTSSIGSLFKWAGQGTSPLLISVSLGAYPYLAWVLIGAEFEERERCTGLWHEVLVQLKGQTKKVNVDFAIKNAATKFKIASFSSAYLSIYRWAQQALDTPIDHPILVLLWQKFFCLYLYRILPSGGTERGCVGEKFLEGMVNFTFGKKLKRRLVETVEYYKAKTMEEEFKQLPPARQLFYTGNLRVFTAYSLWLEEPRLQDSSLYLPVLPPQYEPTLLNLIIQCSENPWFEYVDYETVKSEQRVSIKTWRSANYREKKNVNLPLRNAGCSGESADPVERMFRRLQSYDEPKRAPALAAPTPLFKPLQLKDEQGMMGEIQGFMDTLRRFTHAHAIAVSKLKSLDSGYMERLPQLYRSTTKNMKRTISCTNSAKTVKCSGPAVIYLQAEESKIIENVQATITNNRREYEAVLKSIGTSSRELCMAAAGLQHAVKCLVELKASGEKGNLGIGMFYHLLELLDEDAARFLPTKNLFTDCLERLGQSHIHGDQSETPKLLKYMLTEPSKGIYLAPHFSPHNATTPSFLYLYREISNQIGQKHDLLYSLLSKFNVPHWLETKRPKLSQRSQFIELVLKALLRMGQEPADDALCLHEAYRSHLVHIFEYQFPEHYGEILMHILKASNGGDLDCIAISVWTDILNSLARPIVWDHSWGNKRDLLRQYAHSQQMLHYQELLDTAVLLHRHYTNDRFQYGLYGLYPKTRQYIHVIVLFLGICGHALVISALNTHQGALGDKVCEIVFPYLRDMFMPWVVPYWRMNMKDNMASWIKQLTDDRQVLLPWIPADAPFAQKPVDMFFECILFLAETLPGSNSILSSVWVWYVSHFAHEAVKDHILNVIHHSMISLPWSRFWPSVPDVELMLKVVNQYLPECHGLLGNIFMEVPWCRWAANLAVQNVAPSVHVRIHHCLLNLLVKLSNEPNVRANHGDRLRALLVQSEKSDCFRWSLLDPYSVNQIFDWYVMSCDPMTLLLTDPQNLDFRVFKFLKMVSCYRPMEEATLEIREKREIYIKSYMKLISVFASRYKSLVPSKELALVNLIKAELNDMEGLMREQSEMDVVLPEILTVLNQQPLRAPMIKCFEQWLASREGDGMTIKAVLRVAAQTVFEPEAVATLYETAIETYFYNNVANTDTTCWNEVSGMLQPNCSKWSVLVDALLSKGCVLALHVLLLQKKVGLVQYQPEGALASRCLVDHQPLLNMALNWLNIIKITGNIESKVPLIWADILSISWTFCFFNVKRAAAILYKFAKHLLQISEQKDSMKWVGLLNAIGIGKQSEISLDFKFICRAMAGYVLAQLPDTKGNPATVRCEPNSPCTVGQTGGNSEAPKVLLKLDFGQAQGKIKECAEQALKSIQDPKNSLHNVNEFLFDLLMQFYTKPYLKGFVGS